MEVGGRRTSETMPRKRRKEAMREEDGKELLRARRILVRENMRDENNSQLLTYAVHGENIPWARYKSQKALSERSYNFVRKVLRTAIRTESRNWGRRFVKQPDIEIDEKQEGKRVGEGNLRNWV